MHFLSSFVMALLSCGIYLFYTTDGNLATVLCVETCKARRARPARFPGKLAREQLPFAPYLEILQKVKKIEKFFLHLRKSSVIINKLF